MRAKDIAVTTLLLERGASVNARANGGYTPLHIAAGLGRNEHITLLLKNGADVRAMDARGEPLHAAVAQGHARAVGLLLQARADPNAVTPTGKDTPLTLLTSVFLFLPSHNAIVRQLVEAGANVNARNSYGDQPFQAMVRAEESTALYLLDKGTTTKEMKINGKPVTFAFARMGRLKVLDRLLREHSIRERDHDGSTLLHEAASTEQVNTAAWLIERGLDPNATANGDATPLHYAAFHTNDGVMKVLLAAGGNANARDSKGQTPIYAALAVPSMQAHNHDETLRSIQVLHSYGAKFEVHDHTGMTPLSWYLRHVHIPTSADAPKVCEVARQVVQRGGNAKDLNGDGALHALARRPRFSTMESIVPSLASCLIQLGVDPTARNLKNETALDVATDNRSGAGAPLAKFLSNARQ